jgi:hypothetical protein
MGVTAFTTQPDCRAVCAFMGRAISKAQKAPQHIVCDRGSKFDSKAFRKWCKKKDIQQPRYGRLGKHGSLAVVERSMLTIKCLRMLMPFLSYWREEFVRQLVDGVRWYNQQRPHTWLGVNRTPIVKSPLPFSTGSSVMSSRYRFVFVFAITVVRVFLVRHYCNQESMDQDAGHWQVATLFMRLLCNLFQ